MLMLSVLENKNANGEVDVFIFLVRLVFFFCTFRFPGGTSVGICIFAVDVGK